MKEILTLVILANLLCSLKVFSQDTKLVEIKFYDSKQIQERYTVLKSDKQVKHGEYVSYFKMTSDHARDLKSGIYKLEQFIKIKGSYKNGKKQGEWVEYDQLFLLKTKGKFIDDKKVGIWETKKERGEIIEYYDHDQKKMLPPLINVYCNYPNLAREIGRQGGTVSISYKINKDCSVSDIVITKSVDAEFDNQVIKYLKRISELQMKYSITCEEKVWNRDFAFKLE
jgi:Gram-negative bacterial TonB protein C-terminal